MQTHNNSCREYNKQLKMKCRVRESFSFVDDRGCPTAEPLASGWPVPVLGTRATAGAAALEGKDHMTITQQWAPRHMTVT